MIAYEASMRNNSKNHHNKRTIWLSFFTDFLKKVSVSWKVLTVKLNVQKNSLPLSNFHKKRKREVKCLKISFYMEFLLHYLRSLREKIGRGNVEFIILLFISKTFSFICFMLDISHKASGKTERWRKSRALNTCIWVENSEKYFWKDKNTLIKFSKSETKTVELCQDWQTFFFPWIWWNKSNIQLE